MLSSSAWVSLGKIADPVTGEVRKDLRSAKLSIDTLIMLREKTSGKLDEDEKKLLDVMIGDLQGNYAETVLHPEGDAGAEEQTGEDDSDTEQQAASKKTNKDAKNNEEV
jgi:hypothetical protein